MTQTPESRLAWIDQELTDLDRRGLKRRLSTRTGSQGAIVTIDGRKLINFGSNDYLGLASDSRLILAVTETLTQEGWGSGASPLISGRSETHHRLESRLAQFEDTEAAIVFPSGFAANAGTIAALVGPGDIIFADRKNHASLWDGCRLSRADVRPYPHGDVERLTTLLARASSSDRRRLIVTDSLFSMDGDFAPLIELVESAERFGAMLLVDEAHATGLFGEQGRGVAEHLGVERRIDVRIGTLSKALGSIGGFVVGSRVLIEWLGNRARPYIFSTALPAAAAATALAAFDIVDREPQRRRELLERAKSLRQTLSSQGWNLADSSSQIIPIRVGEPERATRMAETLREQGFFIPAIRPPTVPQGEACLRISLTYSQTAEQIDALIETLALCDS